MQKLLFTAFLFVLNLQVNAQLPKTDWVRSFGENQNSQRVAHAVSDTAGNIYCTGIFNGTFDVNPGSGIMQFISRGKFDVYVSKIDKFGNLIWAKQFGDTSRQVSESIAVDSKGDIYVIGYSTEDYDFDPGSQTASLPFHGNYLLKLNNNGDFISLKHVGSYEVYDIAIDRLDNVYLTGAFSGTFDFDPGANETKLTSKGGTDVFVTKFKENGDFGWAKQFGGADNDRPNAIAVDKFYNIYITGYFAGTADFDPGAGVFNLVSNGERDIFICKLFSTGGLYFATSIGSAKADDGFDIVADQNLNIFCTGYCSGIADYNPGSGVFELDPKNIYSTFLLKLNSSGDFVQAGLYQNNSSSIYGTQLAYNANHDLVVSGTKIGKTDMDLGSGVNELPAVAGAFNTTFIGIYDTTLLLKSAFQIGRNIQGFAIPLNNTLYLAGNYKDKQDCDPGTDSVFTENASTLNLFLAKYTLDLTNHIQNNRTLQLEAYPNPTKDKVHIVLGEESSKTVISVSNIKGQVLSTLDVTNTPNVSIQLPSETGVYIIRVLAENGKQGYLRVIKTE